MAVSRLSVERNLFPASVPSSNRYLSDERSILDASVYTLPFGISDAGNLPDSLIRQMQG